MVPQSENRRQKDVDLPSKSRCLDVYYRRLKDVNYGRLIDVGKTFYLDHFFLATDVYLGIYSAVNQTISLWNVRWQQKAER